MPGDLMVEDGAVVGRLDTRVYRLIAIKKAAHRLAAHFTVSFESVTDEHVHLVLRGKSKWTDAEADDVIKAFNQELLDQELREHVGEETASIRTLILAQAFSKTGLIRGE
jgi:His-Xaa-Ser system protein HxsD